MRIKKVAHVVQQLAMGGMEKILVEFARHADTSRFELQFVNLSGQGVLCDDINACGWRVDNLHMPTGLRADLIHTLARRFRAWGTEVVHTHNTRPLIHAGVAARLAGVRAVVHTRHGQRFGAGRRATALFHLATRTADRVVCVSDDSLRLSLAGIRACRLVRIWNGIDLSRFVAKGPTAGGPVVLVGRLSPEKDVATLLRAWALVLRENRDARLEIAGNGSCLPDLRKLAAESGLNESVTFLGEVRDVPSLLRRASLFVLSSLTEGVSLTLLEAMATGLPVVATRVGGNPEVVAEAETGLLVPPHSPTELARGILEILRDPERGSRLGWAGRRRVEEHFDTKRMVADYEKLYLSILGQQESPISMTDEAARTCSPDSLRHVRCETE